MKNIAIMVMTMAVGVVVSGCSRSDSGNPAAGDTNVATATQDTSGTNTVAMMTQQATEMASNAWEKTRVETTNAWEKIRESLSSDWDYSYDQKDVLLADATNDMATLDEKIQALSDEATTTSDTVKADAQVKMQDLNARRAVLDQKMNALRGSTETNWNEVKVDFKTAYDNTKSSVMSAWQWLKDKGGQ